MSCFLTTAHKHAAQNRALRGEGDKTDESPSFQTPSWLFSHLSSIVILQRPPRERSHTVVHLYPDSDWASFVPAHGANAMQVTGPFLSSLSSWGGGGGASDRAQTPRVRTGKVAPIGPIEPLGKGWVASSRRRMLQGDTDEAVIADVLPSQ